MVTRFTSDLKKAVGEDSDWDEDTFTDESFTARSTFRRLGDRMILPFTFTGRGSVRPRAVSE
jgi:hypothetical protein